MSARQKGVGSCIDPLDQLLIIHSPPDLQLPPFNLSSIIYTDVRECRPSLLQLLGEAEEVLHRGRSRLAKMIGVQRHFTY